MNKEYVCPLFSDKKVKEDFDELKNVVGEVGAYHVWNEQRGYPIDQTPNGKPSKLFADLLQYYNQDREKAIRAKCLTYTKNFKEWFKDSKIVDQNGEPRVVFYEGDINDETVAKGIKFKDDQSNNAEQAVFIKKSQLDNEDSNGTHNINNIFDVKSVDNTGSFSSVDSRIKGSQADESLQFYLAKSVDDEFLNFSKQFKQTYDKLYNQYNNNTRENLDKQLSQLIKKIADTVEARLFILKRTGNKDSLEQKAALTLQLSNLKNTLINKVANIAYFVSNTKRDILPTITHLRDIANYGAKPLSLKELVELRENFFNFYNGTIDDCINTLTSLDGFKEFIGIQNYNQIINDLYNIKMLLDQGSVWTHQMMIAQAKQLLLDRGIEANSPTIESYLHDFSDHVGKDILSITYLLGAGDKVNDEAIRSLFDLIQHTNFEIEETTQTQGNKLLELLHKAGRKANEAVMELDEKGLPTGYFIRRRNYGRFNRDYQQFLSDLRKELGITEKADFDTASPEIRQQYNKRKNEWLSEHCERKYTKEYYDLFNNLSPLAADARELIQVKIRRILEAAKDKDGFTDLTKLNKADRDRLDALRLEKKQLASIYDINGNLKTGEDYKIAVELSELNKKMHEGLIMKTDKTKFAKILAEKKATLSEADFKLWCKYNTREEYTQEFYDKLDELEKPVFRDKKDEQLYNQLNEQKQAILRSFRSDNTREIETLVPGSTQQALDKIDRQLRAVRRRGVMPKTGKKFSDFAKVVPTELAKRLHAEAIENGSEDLFLHTHANFDAQGNYYYKSYLTKVVPIDEKYILRNQPNQDFAEVDESSPFVNKDFIRKEGDENEYMLPKESLYDNSKAYDKVMSNKAFKDLYDALIETMGMSNPKLTNLVNTSNYQLPRMQGNIIDFIRGYGWTKGFIYWFKNKFIKGNDNPEFSSDINQELEGEDEEDNSILRTAESVLKFIPQNYVQQLRYNKAYSRNTVGNVINYFRMAENFDKKNKILNDVKSILYFIGNRNVKSKIRGKSKVGTESNIYKLAKKLIDMQVYGIGTEPIQTHIKQHEINVFGLKMRINDEVIDWTKTLTGLKLLGTIVNLGLNLVCAGTGYLTTTLIGIIHGVTGRYYDLHDSFSAYKTFLTDLFANNITLFRDYNNSTQMHLMEAAGVGAEFHTDLTNQNSIYKQIARNWSFGIYSITEYFSKSIFLNSVMYNYKFVNGEFISHEDFLNKYKDDKVMLDQWRNFKASRDVITWRNGKFEIDPQYKKAFEAKKEVIFNTARNLAQSADGMLTPMQKTVMSSNIIGSFLMMHRQFMPIIIQERFTQARQWDYSTQRYKEAIYRAPMTVMTAMYRDKRNLSLLDKLKQNMTTDQKYALKQLMVECCAMGMMHFLLAPLVEAWADDDDEVWKKILAFIMMRTDFENIMALTPWFAVDAIRTMKTPFPIFSLLENATGFMPLIPIALWNVINGREDNDTIDRGAYEDWPRWAQKLMKTTPFKNLWELQDPESKMRYYETQIIGRSASDDDDDED